MVTHLVVALLKDTVQGFVDDEALSRGASIACFTRVFARRYGSHIGRRHAGSRGR